MSWIKAFVDSIVELLRGLVQALNEVSVRVWGFALVIIGCYMALVSQKYSVSNDISLMILGAGLGAIGGNELAKHQGAQTTVNAPQASETTILNTTNKDTTGEWTK